VRKTEKERGEGKTEKKTCKYKRKSRKFEFHTRKGSVRRTGRETQAPKKKEGGGGGKSLENELRAQEGEDENGNASCRARGDGRGLLKPGGRLEGEKSGI